MKKIDILNNYVKDELVSMRVGVTPKVFIEKTGCDYSEAQIYGAFRRFITAGVVEGYRVGRLRNFRWLFEEEEIVDEEPEVAIKVEPVIKPEVIEYTDKFQEDDDNPDVNFQDVDFTIRATATNKFTEKFLAVHGDIFQISVMNGEQILATSQDETMPIGKENDAIQFCGWLVVANHENFSFVKNAYYNRPVITYKKIKL